MNKIIFHKYYYSNYIQEYTLLNISYKMYLLSTIYMINVTKYYCNKRQPNEDDTHFLYL